MKIVKASHIGVTRHLYADLPSHFFENVNPTPVKNPQLIYFNQALADCLTLDTALLNDQQLGSIFSGNVVPEDAKPIAMAYAGHQFGNFVPSLGDGRAITLGEATDQQGTHYEIQLKGSGKTSFSRMGDGRAALGPVMREYIVSEAMAALKIETTRALALVISGEVVFRQQPLQGAVLTRVSKGLVRVGTFEYFAARNDIKSVKKLADYVLKRFYPNLEKTKNPYLEMYKAICYRQAKLIASWQQVGFIHGVMNTDNMLVSGQTVDYGPCAFMDEYRENQVFSSIDHYGRYAYSNQANIAQWNLSLLGGCLLKVLDTNPQKAHKMALAALEAFPEQFEHFYWKSLQKKFGLASMDRSDQKLMNDFLMLMQRYQADYTLTFRRLSKMLKPNDNQPSYHLSSFWDQADTKNWLKKWRYRSSKEKKSSSAIIRQMNGHNPAYIPRNHLIEKAIREAEQSLSKDGIKTNQTVDQKGFLMMNELLEALSKPYHEKKHFKHLMHPPSDEERVYQTFCGT
ncbi:MAG: YdiU family protein [Pseudomonadota bacterium]